MAVGRTAEAVWRMQVMTRSEVQWVDDYHRQVWDKVAPRLQDKPELLQWLQTNTAPLNFTNAHLNTPSQPVAAVA